MNFESHAATGGRRVLSEAGRHPPRPAPQKPSRLTSDRIFGGLLILLQLFLLSYLSGARVFPAVVAALTLWGLVGRVRLRIPSTPLHLVYAIFTIGFLLHYMFAPFPLPPDSQFIRSALAHSLARLLISVQVLQLFLHHPRGRLPFWLGPCSAITLCFAANLSLPGGRHTPLLGFIAAYIALFAVYSNRTRQAVPAAGSRRVLRWVVLSLILATGLSLGTGASWALQRHERDIEWFLSDYLGYGGRAARAGFTPTGRLESVTAWKTDGAERVMLRIFADDAPGYLRGKVFDTYRGSSRDTSYTPWIATLQRRPLNPIERTREHPRGRPGDSLYEITPMTAAPSRVLDIWPDEGTDSRLFLPLGTRWLAVNGVDLRMDSHGVIIPEDRATSMPYMVFATPMTGSRERALPSSPDVDRQLLTSLKGPVSAEVRDLATEIFDGCRTTQEKVAAIETYFLTNYTYALGINVPHRMDPVTYFLLKRPAAHCEYFATGTAVLLRLADVPCRYVVGYVAREWNSVGGFWVARNKDAHAWVEAFDEERGEWLIVESTPAAGVPQPREPNLASQLADSFKHHLSIWRMAFREYGITAFWVSLIERLWSIPGLVVLLGILGAMLFRYRPTVPGGMIRSRPPDHLRAMHRALERLDKAVRQRGFERASGETLSHFGQRILQSSPDPEWAAVTAGCYRLYVDLRYRGQTGEAAVNQLLEAASRIPTTTRSAHSRQFQSVQN